MEEKDNAVTEDLKHWFNPQHFNYGFYKLILIIPEKFFMDCVLR